MVWCTLILLSYTLYKVIKLLQRISFFSAQLELKLQVCSSLLYAYEITLLCTWHDTRPDILGPELVIGLTDEQLAAVYDRLLRQAAVRYGLACRGPCEVVVLNWRHFEDVRVAAGGLEVVRLCQHLQ